MTFTPRLAVAPGRGLLLRLPHCVLFVPDVDDIDPLTAEAFQTSGDDVARVVVDFVLAQPDTAPSFVFIEWPTSDSGALHLLVRGDASVSSDLASCPELSGAGSATWVEHRSPRLPTSATLRSGDAAITSTALEAGLIPAGGFELQLNATATPIESTSPTADEPTPADGDASAATPSDPTSATGLARLSGIDALLSATDGDWMDDSLQLDKVAPRVPADSGPRPSPSAAVRPDTPAEVSDELPRTRPAGPPAFPGDTDQTAGAQPDTGTGTGTGDFDVETTLPGHLHDPATATHATTPVVRARLCENEHANPPEATRCRQCGSAIDLSQGPITVDQPTLARIQLPDGTQHGLAHTVVLGRRPNADDARLDGPANSHVELISVDAPASVSRTHIKLIVAGWQLFAVDCGSSGGTALLPAAESDLIGLEAWIAHEINEGDRLFLGGPTAIDIHAATGGGASQ